MLSVQGFALSVTPSLPSSKASPITMHAALPGFALSVHARLAEGESFAGHNARCPARSRRLLHCSFWLRGDCKQAERCVFVHDPATKGTLPPLLYHGAQCALAAAETVTYLPPSLLVMTSSALLALRRNSLLGARVVTSRSTSCRRTAATLLGALCRAKTGSMAIAMRIRAHISTIPRCAAQPSDADAEASVLQKSRMPGPKTALLLTRCRTCTQPRDSFPSVVGARCLPAQSSPSTCVRALLRRRCPLALRERQCSSFEAFFPKRISGLQRSSKEEVTPSLFGEPHWSFT